MLPIWHGQGISRLCETIYFTHGTLPIFYLALPLSPFPSLTHISPPPVLQYSSDIWQREGRWLGAPRYNSYFMSSILWILNWIFIAYLIWLLCAQSGIEFGESPLLKQASKIEGGQNTFLNVNFRFSISFKCAHSSGSESSSGMGWGLRRTIKALEIADKNGTQIWGALREGSGWLATLCNVAQASVYLRYLRSH